MNNIIGLIVASIYILVIFLTSKLFEKKGKEVTRKYIHIMLSNIWFISMAFFDNYIIAAILPMLFVIINSLSYKFNLIKIMEREDKKEGIGTVYYAISLTVLSLVTFYINKPILALPGILIMGHGDGLAAVIGQKVKSKSFNILGSTKSIAGSATMLIVSLIISILIFSFIGIEYLILKAFLIAIIATILEAISVKGLDNITVPLIITVIVANII